MWFACRTGCSRRCCVCSVCSRYFLMCATWFFTIPSLWPSPPLLSSGLSSALGCSRVSAARCATVPCVRAASFCCALLGLFVFHEVELVLCACWCICMGPGSSRACCLCVRADSARSVRVLRRAFGRCAPRMPLVCASLRCLPSVYVLSVSGFSRLVINRAARIRGRCVWFFRVYIEVHGAIRGRRASRKSPASSLGVTHGGGAAVGSDIVFHSQRLSQRVARCVHGCVGAAVYDELNSAVQATPTPLPLLAGKRLPGPRRAPARRHTQVLHWTTASHRMPNKTSPVKVAARRTRCKTSSSPAHRCLTPLRQQS
jgi:hypothetical protein